MGNLLPFEVAFRPAFFLELFGGSPSAVAIVLLSTILLALMAFRLVPNHSFSRDEVVLLLTANFVGLSVPARLLNVHLFDIDGTTIYLNAIGAGLPVLIATYLLLKRKVQLSSGFTAILLTSYAAFELGAFSPTRGIVIENFLILPLLAALVAILLHGALDRATAPLAYVSSVFGVVLGGDLIHMFIAFNNHSGIPAVSLGGAGIIDAVFMAGVLAVTLDMAMTHYTDHEPAKISDPTLNRDGH